jgi:hypothetical protein
VDDEDGFTDPDPFSVIATLVALPPNVFPEIVTGVTPHVLPLSELKIRDGGLMQPHDTAKILLNVVHP